MRTWAAVWLTLAMVASLLPVIGWPDQAAGFTPHAPILIVGNGGFTSANGVTGGSGTASDPFVIEGWEINITASHGIEVRDTSVHFVIRNVSLIGNAAGYNALRLYNVTNGSLEASTISKTGIAVWLEDVAHSSIRQSNFTSDYALLVTRSHNITLENNAVQLPGYAIGVGFRLTQDVRDVAILNNTIRTGDWGIFGTDVVRGVIRGNILEGSEDNVRLDDSRQLVVSENYVVGGWVGIGHIGGSGNLYEWNVLRNNQYGLYFRDGSSNHTMRYNLLEDNAYGVYFNFQAGASQIDHNDFVRSGAYDGESSNQWDDGYPSGGNSWSSYVGGDQFRGPNQDEPGKDGIGDIPQPVNVSLQDRYPLMAPVRDAVPPTAPALVGAELVGATYENLVIEWSRSADEGRVGGTTGYRVLGSVGVVSGPFAAIADLPADGSPVYGYVCAGCGHSLLDTNHSFFKVQAFDAANNTASSGLAAKYAKPVAAGWNLLTVPVEVTDDALATVFQTVESQVVVVRAYSASDAVDPWESYIPAKGGGDLSTLPFGAAFWIYLSSSGVYTLAGLAAMNPMVTLQPGWNLVGYASPHEESMAGSLAGVEGATRVEAFDVAGPYHVRAVPTYEMLRWGEGYWVSTTAGDVWAQG